MKTFIHIKTKENFIERGRTLYGDQFSYDKVSFEPRGALLTFQGKPGRQIPEYNRDQHVVITCKDHGDFIQTARKHIEKRKSGNGCSSCALESRTNLRINSEGKRDHTNANPHYYDSNRGVWVFMHKPSDGILREVLVSEEDREILSYASWFTTGHQPSRKGRTMYCAMNGSKKRLEKEGHGPYESKFLKMHRLILERVYGRPLGKDEVVDHMDGNGLNNTRDNLRLVEVWENHANQKKNRTMNGKPCSSKYKGVCYSATRDSYHASINSSVLLKTKKLHLGRFREEEDAARAYDRAALRLFGECSLTNFPREDYSDLVFEQNGENERTRSGFCTNHHILGFQEALCDDEDWEKIKDYRWYPIKSRTKNNPWVIGARGVQVNSHNLYLHDFIMNTPKNKRVVHKNGNIFDNRRENLEFEGD
jgi:hypothetical protein